MRKLIAYITALIMAASCMVEQEQGAVDGSLEGAPVTITFTVPDVPVLPASKSLETGDGNITDTPYLDPDKMYLVVCGGSQSIKYIRRAKLIDTLTDQEVPEDKYPISEGSRTVTLYKFEVQLELYDFGRTIHFLGNVDENQLITGSYSYNSLPNMLSYDNKQAYWQRLYVPHIKAKIDPETDKPMKRPDGSFVPDEETESFFQYIPLIRNFAKIQVTNAAENFHLHSYAVIFYPERGSVTPYRSNESVKVNRFDFNPPTDYLLSGYERCSFDQLDKEIIYLGNMPSGIALSNVIPPASEFEDPSSSDGRVLLYKEGDDDSGFFIYERGIPTEKIGPTFVIVCGKFEEEDQYYYYRLDLMETAVEDGQTVARYYPIYRNFRYNIQLHRISSEGVLTPEAAANSSGVEDISADFSMRHLTDISNGTTRLVVEPFMTRTYSGPAEDGAYYELYARFFNSVNSAVPNTVTAAVRVELEPMTDGSDDILILYDDNGSRVPTKGYFFPVAATVGGVEGIRTIHFNTVEPLDETKTQKIKITGHNPGTHKDLRLYREVEITLQKKQPLTVTCTTPVQSFTGMPITVGITIPSELPESMFPLKFIVEPEAKSLTPDTSKNINMPVVSGKSIATSESAFKDTPAFYYIRTLTWEEFQNLDVSEEQRTFYCYFKTNRDFNATTIWVYNEYFSKGRASFENKNYLGLTCTDPVFSVEKTPVTLSLSVHSSLPASIFPLDFIVEPEKMTLGSKNGDMLVVTGPSIATDASEYKDTDASHFIRRLTYDEYQDLPVIDNKRSFDCEFITNVAQSATTIWVYNELFFKGKISFQNEEPHVVLDDHFWVLAVENCTVKLNNSELQYKLDDGTWKNYSKNTGISLSAGHKLSFKGGSAKSKKTWGNAAFNCTGGQFKVGGNIASLAVGDDYLTAGATVTGVSFIDFFKNHTKLIDASELELPMLKLTTNAYKSMFDGCTNLVNGPAKLPATSLGTTCYRNMFNECKSLTAAPELPATDYGDGAYQKMFSGCSSLTHIKMLGTKWKQNVFYSVDDPKWTPVNPYVDRGTGNEYVYYWCDGVASAGVIEMNIAIQNAANWSTTWGEYAVPSGWTVEFVSAE